MLKSRSLLFHAGLSGAASAGGRVLRFFVASMALRLFGSASWGEVAFALTLMTYVNFVLDFGISSLALIDNPDDIQKDRSLFVSLFYVRGLLALALSIPALLVLPVAGIAGGKVLAVYLLLTWVRPWQLDWFWQRKGFAGLMPLLQFIRQALLLSLLWFQPPPSIVWLVAADVFLEAVVGVVCWFLGPKRTFRMGWPNTSEWKAAWGCFRASGVLFAASSLMLLYQSADVFFLRAKQGLHAVGVYDYGYRFVLFAFQIGASLSIPLRRQMARMRVDGRESELPALLKASHNVLGLLSAGFLLFALYFSPLLLNWSLRGEEAQLGHTVMVVLAVWLVLSFYAVPLGEWLLTGSPRRFLQLAILATGVNMTANAILVSRLGPFGAAWSKVISEFAVFIFLLLNSTSTLRQGIRKVAWGHALLLPLLLVFVSGIRFSYGTAAVISLAIVLVWTLGGIVGIRDLRELRRH